MKKVILFLFVAILATSCNAQDSQANKLVITKAKVKTDSTTAPKARWKVNKELDEHGNIIRYDSIYIWSSSGNLKDLANADSDSLISKMQSLMHKRFSMFQSPNTNDFVENDSIIKQFFSEDFFFKGMPNSFIDMQDMMKRMEAMSQQFFYNDDRYIIPPEEKSENKTSFKKQRI